MSFPLGKLMIVVFGATFFAALLPGAITQLVNDNSYTLTDIEWVQVNAPDNTAPQGRDMSGLSVVGNIRYAVSDYSTGGGTVFKKIGNEEWTIFHSFSSPGTAGKRPTGIFALSETDIWVAFAGQDATNLLPDFAHYDGNTWTDYTKTGGSLRRYNFFSIWGTASDNIWAVDGQDTTTGENTHMWHWNGISWNVDTSAGSPDALLGMYGFGANDIWAVGFDISPAFYSYVIHYDGISWTRITSPQTVGYRSVWGANSNDVWAVGNSGSAAHWDGNLWVQQTLPVLTNLNAIHGVDGELWAVGNNGRIIHYKDNVWEIELNTGSGVGHFHGVWAFDTNPYNTNHVSAVGVSNSGSTGTEPVFYEREGTITHVNNFSVEAAVLFSVLPLAILALAVYVLFGLGNNESEE